MRKLFLHIGTGKTGSTSIQKSLEPLKDKRVSFSFNMNGIHAIPDPVLFANNLAAQAAEITIYSNEWLYTANAEFIAGLADALNQHFETEVIIYLRRQDQFKVSSYQQVSKRKGADSQFGPVALPQTSEHRSDYLKFINRWAARFGKENICIRVFDKARLYKGDVISDFAKLTGVSLPESQFIHSNISNGAERTKIGHLLNLSGLRQNNSQLAGHISEAADNTGKLLPSEEAARRYYEQYRETNIKLNEEFGISDKYPAIFDEDFSQYPTERDDLWTEESANRAITNIFAALSTYPSGCNRSHLLLNTAKELKHTQPELSYQLLQIILQEDPGSEEARKLLNNLKKKRKSWPIAMLSRLFKTLRPSV